VTYLSLLRILSPVLLFGGLAFGAYTWHTSRVSAFVAELRSEDDRSRAATAIKVAEASIELKGQLYASQQQFEDETKTLADRIADLSRDDGVRDDERKAFAVRIAAATANQARAAAETFDADLDRSRNHIVRFGQEAAQCSALAYKQARDLDAIDNHWLAYQNALKGTSK